MINWPKHKTAQKIQDSTVIKAAANAAFYESYGDVDMPREMHPAYQKALKAALAAGNEVAADKAASHSDIYQAAKSAAAYAMRHGEK